MQARHSPPPPVVGLARIRTKVDSPFSAAFARRQIPVNRNTGGSIAPMMKKNQRPTRWWWVGGVCLTLALVYILSLRRHSLPLPAVVRYGNLPARFGQTLKETRARVLTAKGEVGALRKLARLYQANRLYPEARICYRLLAAMPAGLAVRDHYYLADLALNEGDLDAAQKEYRTVLESEPNYLPARLALAEVLFKSGRADEAAKEYSAILVLDANHPQATLGLARIDLQRGDDESAVARLEELMVVHPESTSGAALFAKVLERRGETDRAIAVTQWSLQKPEPIPADPWMSELLTDLYDVQLLGLRFEDYFKTRQLDQAFPLLQRIEELDPKSPVPPLLRGWAESQSHHDPEAVQQYRLALNKGGDPEKIGPYLVQSLLKLGRVAEAAKLMEEYSAKLPDSVPLATAYADVAVRLGDDKLSRQLLTKVLAKEPYLQPQNMSLAKILWTAGERDAAAKCLQRVASVSATDIPSRALLGEYYLGIAEPVAAIRPLEQALKFVAARTPAHASLRGMLGTAYYQAGNAEAVQGRPSEAVGYFDRAIKLDPSDPKGYAGKANVFVRQRQFRPAAEALTQLARLQPENPTIHLSLGDVVFQEGDAAQAQRHWQKARELTAVGDLKLQNALDVRLSGRITADTFQ